MDRAFTESREYSQLGEFTTAVEITIGQGADLARKAITVGNSVNAEFIATPLSGTVLLEVGFTDQSATVQGDRTFGGGTLGMGS